MTEPTRPVDDAFRAEVGRALETRGFALVHPDPRDVDPATFRSDPWEGVVRLTGKAPELLERQPVAPVPWGRSFASTKGFTPLHTDSQLYAGRPAELLLMACECSASEGGESKLLDTWALLRELEVRDKELWGLLFDYWRKIPFLFGAVTGPTLSLRQGRAVFTHSPQLDAGDVIAARLAPYLATATVHTLRPEAGDVLLVDNQRMLHGRAAFRGDERVFTRILAFLPEPWSRPAAILERAWIAQDRNTERLASLPELARRRLGFGETPSLGAARRQIVLDMLRGVPPGVLARRHSVDEAELYRWRDLALRSVDAALEDAARELEACESALSRLLDE